MAYVVVVDDRPPRKWGNETSWSAVKGKMMAERRKI
jgi:hypothetical protein